MLALDLIHIASGLLTFEFVYKSFLGWTKNYRVKRDIEMSIYGIGHTQPFIDHLANNSVKYSYHEMRRTLYENV